jgi:(S)-ureidoglycine aminohydrolase
VIFVVAGAVTLTLGAGEHLMEAGGYAYLPPGASLAR